jgi:signal transduction histidine kinase
MDQQVTREPVRRSKKGCRGGGRPRAHVQERRTGRIGVAVNEQEEQAIEQRAAQYRMRKGPFLRRLGLGHRMRPPATTASLEAHRALGEITRELQRMLSMIDERGYANSLRDLAEKMMADLKVTRLNLLGNSEPVGGEESDDREAHQR